MATDIEVTYGKDQSLPAEPIEGRLELVGDGPLEAYVGTDSGWEKITDKDKANTDGFYEGMTVGHALEADQLASDRQIDNPEEACPPITFGPVGGNAEVQDGYSKFEELRGNTVCWNQFIQGFSTTLNNELECTIDGNYMILNGTVATDWAVTNYRSCLRQVAIPENHKIAAFFDGHDKIDLYFIGLNYGGTFKQIDNSIITASNGVFRFSFVISAGTTFDNERFLLPWAVDLTQLTADYSTVAAFRQDYPLPYYAYNPGQLLSSKSASLIVRGRNQWDEQWELGKYNLTTGMKQDSSVEIRNKNPIKVLPNTVYFFANNEAANLIIHNVLFYDGSMTLVKYDGWYSNNTFTTPTNCAYINFYMSTTYGTTYNNDICIYINYDTPGLLYVAYEQQVVTLPNIELKSAGTARDVAYQTGGGKRRIGSVDLGTLEWTYDGTKFYTQQNAVDYIKVSSNNTVASNLLCSKYLNVPRNNLQDKCIAGVEAGSVGDEFSRLFVMDSSYTDAATFKTAMSGVYLYYELATETDITTEENPGWTELVKIDNFGTLEYTTDPAQTPQVPQAYFIRYTVNLGEWVDSAYVKTNGDPNNIITNTDYASGSQAGVVKVGTGNEGVKISSGGLLALYPADKNQIKTGVAYYPPISAYMLSIGVFYGLAKAAGANLNSPSAGETAPPTDASASGVYPASAKKAICDMLGAFGTKESYTISSWTALSDSAPYSYQATVTATYTIGNDTTVELLNDQAVLFATYGFAIGSVSGQSITIYSVGQPSSSVTLGVKYYG